MAVDEIILNVVFYAIALLGALCALGVASSRNIVRSCFALLGLLTAVAGIYLLAWADFLFAAQVLIYIGGILVLVIFAVMLTHRITDVRVSNESVHSFGAFLVAVLLFATIATVVETTDWDLHEAYRAGFDPGVAVTPKGQPIAADLGRALAGPHVLAFEFIGMLLLVAIVGASFLARKEVK